MARIRTIKPEFWTDEKLSLLDPLVRLVYLGLISQADDAGRLLDNVKLLDGMLFPNTDDSCRDALDTLARLSRVSRYRTSNGQSIIQIVKWEQHQKVDNPSKHVLPGPEHAVLVQPPVPPKDTPSPRNPRETLATLSRDPSVTTLDHGPRITDHGPTTVELVDVVRSDSANGSGTGTALITVGPDPRARIGTVLAGVAEGARRRGDADRERSAKAEFLFAYWALVMDHPRAIYDDKRKKRIESALRENRGDVGELLYAVDGARKTPYLMGENETRTRYDGVETVLRDRAQIEKLAAKCPAYQRGEPHPRLQELEAA
jgi:hypothetical protein